MRISKKFSGSHSVGAQYYKPSDRNPRMLEAIKESDAKLEHLREMFLNKLGKKVSYQMNDPKEDDDDGRQEQEGKKGAIIATLGCVPQPIDGDSFSNQQMRYADIIICKLYKSFDRIVKN